MTMRNMEVIKEYIKESPKTTNESLIHQLSTPIIVVSLDNFHLSLYSSLNYFSELLLC